VLHGDLESVQYHLADMNTQYPKIEEAIEFLKVLTVKQLPEKNWKLVN
jgi:hypothetical protein